MGGNSIFLDRELSPEELLHQMVLITGVDPADIYIPDYTAETTFGGRGYALVVADMTAHGPAFPTGLFIVTDTGLPDPEDPAFARQLCRQLDCQALIEAMAPRSDRLSSTIYWLVRPDGQLYRVAIEDEAFYEDPPRYVVDLAQGMQPVTWPMPSGSPQNDAEPLTGLG